jgi:septum formation protein
MNADHVYLASHEGGRGELLGRIGAPFELLRLRAGQRADPEVSDEIVPGETPLEHAHRVALARAMGGVRRVALRQLRHGAVLGCATVIDLEGETLIRPASIEAAAQVLRRLSGRSHRVLTAVVIADRARSAETVSATEVRFARLSEADVARCLSHGVAPEEPGAYSLLGPAAAHIQQIHGSCSGVMGLPLHETAELLRNFGGAD